MPIGDLYRQADQYAAQVRARDAATLRQLADAYGRIYRTLSANVELLNLYVANRIQAGRAVTDETIIRSAQYRELVRQTREQLDQFGEFAAGLVTTAQDQAVQRALAESDRLLRIGVETGLSETVNLGGRTLRDIAPAFQRLPVEAVTQLIGTLGDGTPLRRYFLEGAGPDAPPLADDVITHIRQSVARGLAQGWNPRVTANLLRESMGIGLTRALRIARTETLRSYREATRANYAANGIEQWEWLATLSDRTCLACLALDGQVFPIDQPMQSHVSCRCTMIPVLPFAVPRIRRVQTDAGGGQFTGTGSDWFEGMDEALRMRIMGPSKYRAYAAGMVALRDFIGRHETATFGTNFVEASLRQILGEAAQQFYAN